MGQAAWPMARHAPSPSPATSRPAPPPPPATPAARRPDTPRKSEQDATRISGNGPNYQEASKHTQNEVHHAKAMSSAKGMLRLDSSDKHRMPRSSGGIYSKPDARVKLIPAEEITYVQHRKPYCRNVGSGLPKRQCRRSVTPPPSSRKVSVLPMPSAPSDKSYLSPKRLETAENGQSLSPKRLETAENGQSFSPKRLETAENGHSLVREHITSSATHQIASLKDPAPPSCKSSQPSSTSLNIDASTRNLGRMDMTEAFSRCSGSHILHSHGQSSEQPEEEAIKSDSSNPKQVFAPHSSEDHLGTKAGPSKSASAPENGKLRNISCNLAPRSTAAPVSQSSLLSPTSVFGQKSTVVYPDGIRIAAPILRKHVSPSLISRLNERSTEICPDSKSWPKEAAINPVSPSPKQMLAPLSGDHLGTKAGLPFKCVCTPENGNSCSRSCDIAMRSAAAPVSQSPVAESGSQSQTPVLGKSSTELYTNGTRTAAPIQQKPIAKHALPSPTPLLRERSSKVYVNSKSGLKKAAINTAPNPEQVLAPGSSEDHLGTKAGPSSKSGCTPENGELFSRSCSSATVSIAAPVLQSSVVESALPSRTTVLGERSTEVLPDRIRTAGPIQQDTSARHALPSQMSLLDKSSSEVYPISKSAPHSSTYLFNGECDLASLQQKSALPTHSSQSTAPAQCNASINRDTSSEFRHKDVHETASPAILHTKLHRKHYQSEAPWRGNFHITGELDHTCDGLEAHFPLQINFRAYEASKQIPKILKLEAVALSQLWPKKFKMKPPDGQDIGLCFISSHQRPHRSFDHLLEKISSHIGLWTNIGDVQLSIFSSRLLTPDCQRKDGNLYFWGVFGKHLKKNQRRRKNQMKNIKISKPSQSNEDSDHKSKDASEDKETERSKSENGMTVDSRGGKERDMDKSTEIGSTMDVTEGNETDGNNECAAVLGTPNSNPTSSCAAPGASFLAGCCSRDSANKNNASSLEGSPCQPSSISLVGSDLMLDIPPGFSLKIDRVNEFSTVHGTPNLNAASSYAAPAASILSECCSRDSASKNALSLADHMSDTTPGFSLKTDRVNDRVVVFGSPNSNAASSWAAPTASLLKGGCSRDSVNKSTSSLAHSPWQPVNISSAGSDLMLDTPTGFSLTLPPGFTRAHCGTEATAVFNAPPSLVADTPAVFPAIPPGFTEAHCRLPAITSTGLETGVSTAVTEKKPLIRFSLHVPRLVKTEVLPGFTTRNAVKKEPGSPAVDKAMENPTTSSLVPGESSIRNAGKADVMEILRDEVGVEQDEEPEVPRFRRLAELYRRPRSCTEVCRSGSSNQADKFQATEAHEKQRHQGKRGLQEPPKSPADTSKRLKVNGRITLNNGADRQTLNPDKDQENSWR